MSDKPTRRWFQFRIASLLWLMLITAVATYAIREHRENLEFSKEVRDLRARVKDQEDEIKFSEAHIEVLSRSLKEAISGLKVDDQGL